MSFYIFFPFASRESRYGWRNGAKLTKFIFIHIQCSYWYSRIYLFTFNNRIYIQEIYLFTFTCVFLIHDYICSHLRDVFIHIQRVISIHIHDQNIHSTFTAHHLCASVSKTWTAEYGLRTTDWVKHALGIKHGLGIKHRLGYKRRTKNYGLGIKYGLRFKTRTVRCGLGIKLEERFYKLNKFSHERFYK